jgi:hypothetical protein
MHLNYSGIRSCSDVFYYLAWILNSEPSSSFMSQISLIPSFTCYLSTILPCNIIHFVSYNLAAQDAFGESSQEIPHSVYLKGALQPTTGPYVDPYK